MIKRGMYNGSSIFVSTTRLADILVVGNGFWEVLLKEGKEGIGVVDAFGCAGLCNRGGRGGWLSCIVC